ncbi:MAG: GNAT family N-acetyltransferase [Pseudomonadota bacterium]
MERIDGKFVSLRLARPEDAGFIYDLRRDPLRNAYLSEVTGGVDGQTTWLERYLLREAAGEELYYVIERSESGESCGLVRLYDIEGNRCTWGSFILAENKPRKAALEAALLSFQIAFEALGLERVDIDVRNRNQKARDFYVRFGMEYVGHDETDTYFSYTSAQFSRDRKTHAATIASA